ncbi:hypothetical protein ACP4OV_027333 [Aristida adscensionis]
MPVPRRVTPLHAGGQLHARIWAGRMAVSAHACRLGLAGRAGRRGPRSCSRGGALPPLPSRGAAAVFPRAGHAGLRLVVEEIERLHGRRKKARWLEVVGIRRDALPFHGGALRSLRLTASGPSMASGNDGDGHDMEEWEGERGASGGGSASCGERVLQVIHGAGSLEGSQEYFPPFVLVRTDEVSSGGDSAA